jgi:hypothetical protein
VAVELFGPICCVIFHRNIERRLVEQRCGDVWRGVAVGCAPARVEPLRQIGARGEVVENLLAVARDLAEHRVHQFRKTARFLHVVRGFDGLADCRVRWCAEHQQLRRTEMQQSARMVGVVR